MLVAAVGHAGQQVALRHDRVGGGQPAEERQGGRTQPHLLVAHRQRASAQTFDRGLPLPERRAELLLDIGGPAAEVGAADLPDDTQVCNCNGVSKATICGAVAGGSKSVTAVMDKTRAGKGCGSCTSLVAQIVE